MARNRFVALLAVLVSTFGAAASVPAHGVDHRIHLRFNRPVALPGVTLGSGTYIFELPDSSAYNLVRVRSRDGDIVYLTAFTKVIERPADLPRDQHVSFAEAPGDKPQPIVAWWPPETSNGRQFIYEQKR